MAEMRTAREAIAQIPDEATVMVGGFGLVGAPDCLIQALAAHNVKDLTIVGNDLGGANEGLGVILLQNKIKKAIGSFFTPNPDVARYVQEGKLEVELIPQGNYAEAIRAAGAGLGGFLTPVGVGTELAKGRQVVALRGREYLLQEPITADFALIRAKKADRLGNLVYDKAARNFNPIMAAAAKVTIVEADEIVETGAISPEEVITPFLYVDFVVDRGEAAC